MKFLEEELEDGCTVGGIRFKTIQREPIDQDRWHTYYDWIFEVDGHFYNTTYKRGSTEMQEADDPFDFCGAEHIDLEEVFPTPVTTIQYLTRNAIDKLNQK